MELLNIDHAQISSIACLNLRKLSLKVCISGPTAAKLRRHAIVPLPASGFSLLYNITFNRPDHDVDVHVAILVVGPSVQICTGTQSRVAIGSTAR